MTEDKRMVWELERILALVNTRLKKLLPSVKDPAFTDSDVRKAVEEAEQISRWKRTPLHEADEPYSFAFARAQLKAKENGEPFVVAETGDHLVVVSRVRFLEEKPFGMDERHILFESGKS